jgi:hypothetical protein
MTAPAAVSAQADDDPTETAVTPLVRLVTCTATVLSTVELFPSWPAQLFPQHSTPPLAVTAQAESDPTDTAATLPVSPGTCTGARLLTMVLSPNADWPSDPQHSMPAVVPTHADEYPTDTDSACGRGHPGRATAKEAHTIVTNATRQGVRVFMIPLLFV